MSVDLYKCATKECALYNKLVPYECEWLGVRPVCQECKEPPMLEPSKCAVSLNTKGCTPTSKKYTH